MSRTLGTLLGLLFVAAGASPQGDPTTGPPAPAPTPEAERPSAAAWLHNPRARTAAGLERLAEEETEAALDAFDEALALAPDDPRLQFNAGTASLAGDGEGAVELLETAARAAPADLAADALYNLGTARLSGGDPAGAIEAFEQSLRLEPANPDAKHNLELARRLLERQEKQEQQQEQGDEGDGDSQQQREQDGQQDQQDQQHQQDQDREQPPGDSPPRSGDQPPPDDSRQPLPDFEEQPEMTAEQAAAILEAVENLEREQRRQQAREQRKRAKGDRDW
ncbi:MAG: tetratricopeptide repeat protein [Thermoanaerobaculia bacterium]|nr:tetratricopeptide repeat protein [Thermoanaerobaculia bacterium]